MIIVSGLVGYGIYSWRASRTPSLPPASDPSFFRDRVARYVLNSSIWGLVILASIIVIVPAVTGIANPNALTVFNSLLPIFGTWVGTLLAFYFSKENFEAASKSMTDMAQSVTQSSNDKLQSTAAKSVMIPAAQIITLPAGLLGKANVDIPLGEIVKYLRETVKKDRLPLFKGNQKEGSIAGVVHLSIMEKFIASRALASNAALGSLSLDDLAQDATFKPVFDNSFGVAEESASLGRVKSIMDNLAQKLKEAEGSCYDVFLTSDGKPESPVLGWITNDIINDKAKV